MGQWQNRNGTGDAMPQQVWAGDAMAQQVWDRRCHGTADIDLLRTPSTGDAACSVAFRSIYEGNGYVSIAHLTLFSRTSWFVSCSQAGPGL